MTDRSSSTAADRRKRYENHYDRHYSSGGFGQDEKRSKWMPWLQKHYLEAFDVPLPHEYKGSRAPRVLDVPSGDGFWSSLFDELGYDIEGLELSAAGVRLSKERYQGIPFQQANAEDPLPVPEESFDLVFSRAISHLHRPQLMVPETIGLFKNLIRYAAPHGQLLVSYYTRRDGKGTDHHHYHPISDLVGLLEQAGDVYRVDVVDHFVQIGVMRRS